MKNLSMIQLFTVLYTEFVSTAAEALPAGSGCAESKNKHHKRAV